MQDLVRVLPERLHLHAGHRVVQPLELLVPGRGRCGEATATAWSLPPTEATSPGAPVSAQASAGGHPCTPPHLPARPCAEADLAVPVSEGHAAPR